jgi:glycosyltransferase involved in cell wall biosynthesis
MLKNLSILIINKNSEETILRTLKSINNFSLEVIILDNGSTDLSLKIISKFTNKIYISTSKSEYYLRKTILEYSSCQWILVLDSDEIVNSNLKNEIQNVLENQQDIDGYYINYRNFLFNKPLFQGGENYKKLRLFKKNKINISKKILHADYFLKTKKIGYLKNYIEHYSYRNVIQIFSKFTRYAWLESKNISNRNIKIEIKHFILYPLHMFYSRFIKDRGYKDGYLRIILDGAFAYMEFMIYLFAYLRKIRK